MKLMETREAMIDESEFNNTLILDSLNFAFRYKHSKAKTFSQKYLETVRSFAKSYEAGRVIITGDGGSDYRKAIFPDYKGNRKELQEKQTAEEAEEFKEFFEEYSKTLELLSQYYPVLKFKGVEADDIIAYICNEKSELGHIWIISSDKDLDQLISPTVSRFSFITRKEITWENWSEHYPYPQDAHIHVKCLQGDSGDNVPGVPGVGPKRAAALVDMYGSIFDIHGQLPLPGSSSYIKSVNSFGNQLLTNLELMDLPTYCEEALLTKDNIKEIERAVFE